MVCPNGIWHSFRIIQCHIDSAAAIVYLFLLKFVGWKMEFFTLMTLPLHFAKTNKASKVQCNHSIIKCTAKVRQNNENTILSHLIQFLVKCFIIQE